jgi:hypothetical protein
VLIRLRLDHITLLDQLTAAAEDEIEAALDAIPASWSVSADGVPSAGPGPGAAVLPAAERLTEIPGVSLKLARAIIAETGLDMATWLRERESDNSPAYFPLVCPFLPLCCEVRAVGRISARAALWVRLRPSGGVIGIADSARRAGDRSPNASAAMRWRR